MLKETCGPHLKILYLLRDPIARMQSQYLMRVRLHTLGPEISFEQWTLNAIDDFSAKEPPLLEWLNEGDGKPLGERGRPPCLFESDVENPVWSGLYIVHLARWKRLYDKLLVFQSEAFFQSPAPKVISALEFIGLDPKLVNVDEVVSETFNAAPSTDLGGSSSTLPTAPSLVELTPETTKRLCDLFGPYAKALKTMIPTVLDLNRWKSCQW